MRVSKQQVMENRRTILKAAGRLFKAKGFEAVSVSDVMKAAGLTHGGFYGYFGSKDELIAEAIANLRSPLTREGIGIDRFLDLYLSADHQADLAEGCPVAALAHETSRQRDEAKTAMTAALKRQLQEIGSMLGSDEDATGYTGEAVGICATMIGALILARMSNDPVLSEEILSAAKRWINRNMTHA